MKIPIRLSATPFSSPLLLPSSILYFPSGSRWVKWGRPWCGSRRSGFGNKIWANDSHASPSDPFLTSLPILSWLISKKKFKRRGWYILFFCGLCRLSRKIILLNTFLLLDSTIPILSLVMAHNGFHSTITKRRWNDKYQPAWKCKHPFLPFNPFSVLSYGTLPSISITL